MKTALLTAAALTLALLLAASAFGFTMLFPPLKQPGFCSVSPRPEVPLDGRSLVYCRWLGADVTGDGVPEQVELRLFLNRKGNVDCSISTYAILDVTQQRNQAIRIAPAC